MSAPPCCLKGFEWDGTPTGRTGKLADNDAYITGDNPDAAVLYVADLLGWTFPNARLLADHYAREADVTVYVPDFFAGEVPPSEPLLAGLFDEFDMDAFARRHWRTVREPEVFACARALRRTYARVGAVGFCYGGWAVCRLGAAEHRPPLVDCVTAGHPTHVTRGDIDELAVPVQVLAPEFDPVYTAELKSHTFETLQRLGVPFDYQHFPGLEHAFLVRGYDSKPGEREGMARGKNAAVNWFKLWLHGQ